MKTRTVLGWTVAVLVVVLAGGCGGIDVGLVQIKVPAKLGLDSETLKRIDDVNQTIRDGFGLDSETRALIADINRTLQEGVDVGLDDETLQTIDRLLADIESGVEIGLDYETRQTMERLISTLGAAPGDWSDALQQIINALEGSACKVADEMAAQVQDLLTQATQDIEEIGASTGQEFRCNVDFLGAKLTNTVNDFVGLSMVDRLKTIILGRKITPGGLEPVVCQILPNQVVLEKVGQELNPDKDVIIVTGYGFADTDGNRPEQVYLDAGNAQYVSIRPLVTTSYLIQLNLQPIDFSQVSKGSEVVFVWPGDITFRMPVLLPPEPAPEPQAVVNVRTHIFKGPGARYHEVWQGEVNESFKVIGRDGGRTWWQIEYNDKNGNPQRGWIPADKVTATHVEEVPVASVPDPPTARFTAAAVPEDPLKIKFENQSVGEHPEFAWNFGDGSIPSVESAPVHPYTQAGQYTVTLKVADDWGTDETSQAVSIVVAEPVVAHFDAGPQLTGLNPLDVTFTNNSTGPITGVLWDFGDGSTSNDMNHQIVHRYFYRPEPYQVTLTVRDDRNGRSTQGGVLVTVKPFSTGSVFFQWYRGLVGKVNLDTHIDRNQYYCGIVGLSVSGDIEEVGRGDIVKAVMRQMGTSWWIEASFRTEDPAAQAWDINIMCIDNQARDRFSYYSYGWAGRDRYPDTAGSLADTGMNGTDWLCGIVGFMASDGDMQEEGVQGTIFEVMPSMNSATGTWGISADVATHITHERWDAIDVLCVVNDPTLFRFQEFQIPAGAIDTRLKCDGAPCLWNDYVCGLVGMGIYRADINEKAYGPILTGTLGWNNQGWFAMVNFLTEGYYYAPARRGAALCVSTTIAKER